MNKNFLEFKTNKGTRILLDFDDIRAIKEGGKKSEGYCKIFFHSSTDIFEWVHEDYNSVIEKLNNLYKKMYE